MMKQYLTTGIAAVVILCALSATSVMAQAHHEHCYKVDQDNLKLYQKYGDWRVHDITNNWDRNFRVKASAERFLAVLKNYKARVFCTRYIGGNNTLMSYLLTDGHQPLTGSMPGGENCTTFEASSLKAVWSDETNSFSLTDGSTVVVSVSFFRKGDLEDIIGIIKKYNFGARCSDNPGLDVFEYWKAKPTRVAISRDPVLTGRLLTTNPKKEPLPKPAGMEEWQSLGGNLGSGVAAVLQWTGKENRIHVFAKGVDGALWTRTSTRDVWTEWTSLGGVITSEPSAATFDSDNLVVVARGVNNAVWFRRLSGGKWDLWKSLEGSLKGAPAITSRGADRYQVYGVGDDQAIWQHSFDGRSAGTWTSLGKARKSLKEDSDEIGFIYGPAAVSPSSKTTEVYAIGSDSQLYYKKWLASCDCWTIAWEELGGDLTSTPSAVLLGDGNVLVMARGRDQELWKIFPTQYRTSSWTSLGGKLWSNPAAVRNDFGGFAVFGVASDNALWWRSFKE